MPALPQLVVEDSNGAEKERIDCITASRTQSLVEMWTATATVDRGDWTGIVGNVDEINDRLVIERGDGTILHRGRFGDDKRDGNTIDVIIPSFERDAQDAEPSDPRDIYGNANDDDAVFTDAISAVSTLSTGTVETGATSVSFTFAHASRAKQARDAAEPDAQDIAYRNDLTVDFLDRLGSDKSGSITLSPSNQNIVESLEVAEQSRDPITHVRGLGGQSGGEQVRAEAVISSYSAGERQVWRKYVNKDVMNTDRLQGIVDRLAAEADTHRTRLTVECTVVDEDVSIGDSVQVALPADGIDTALRIVRLVERLSNQGSRFALTLTNRQPDRGGDRKRRDDLERFNSGDQGFVDRDNAISGWNNAGDSTPQTLRIPDWPDDIVREDQVELFVLGRKWRSPVKTATADNADYNNIESVDDVRAVQTFTAGSWDTVTTFNPASDCSRADFYTAVRADTSGDSLLGNIRLYNSTQNEYVPDTSGFRFSAVFDDTGGGSTTTGPWASKYLYWAENVKNDFIEVQIKQDGGRGDAALLSHTTMLTQGPHIHESEPQVVTSFNGTEYYPTDVDIDVNGTFQTTLSGNASADWTESVDLSGLLTSGENTITATPTGDRGALNLILKSQLFRSGGPSP